jgi:hypothetical protein
VTQFNEVASCLITRTLIINHHHPPAKSGGFTVEANEWWVTRGPWEALTGGSQEDALYAPTNEHAEKISLHLHVLVRVAQHQRQAMTPGLLFRSSEYFRKERIRNMGNHHPDGAGTAYFEVSSYFVRVIIEGLDRRLDSLC